MASLENLKNKILADAKLKADEIIREAEDKASLTISQRVKEAEVRKENILSRAKTDAELLSERITSSGNLEARNEILKAKGLLIDKVIDRTKEKLKNIELEDYITYVTSKLDEGELKDGEKLIVDKRFLEEVKNKFQNVEVEGVEGLSGFKVDKKGIVENYSFDKIVDFRRDELSQDIIATLFR